MNLVLRPSSKGPGHTGSLTLRLIHDRRVKSVTLPGCRLFAEEWDQAGQTVLYPQNNPRRAAELESMESKINHEMEILGGFVARLQSRGHYTVDELLGLYREKKDDGKLLGYAETLASELERNNRRRTARAYRTVVRGLVRYNRGEDIPLAHINPTLIRGFEKHLRDEGKLPNTVAYYMRNLRAIYNKAVVAKRIVGRGGEKPFAGISTAVTKTMKRALPLEDLQALYALDFGKLPPEGNQSTRKTAFRQNLHRSRRYFFFCVFARGMSWVDLAHLRKDNIRGGVMRYCRKKTGQQIEVRLTRELNAIITSFADEVAGSPYVFPIIRDNGKNAALQYETALRTQNNRLKRLAELAGIDRNVSTHVARHSWASVGKEENLPTQVISESLGHTSQETTQIYLALLNNRVLDEANERVARAIRRPFRGCGRAAGL
jgi:Site-specific recombinase XerD